MSLGVKDLISQAYHRVCADERPSRLPSKGKESFPECFAVFEEEVFVGLLERQALGGSGERIFADLLHQAAAPTVSDKTAVEEALQRMEAQGAQVVAVLDSEGQFTGVVTRRRIYEFLRQNYEGRLASFGRLVEAGLDLTRDLSLERVLQRIAEEAARLASARYGALGVLDEAGHITQLYAAGIDDHRRAAIGPLPQCMGVLGLLIRGGYPIRLRDIAQHPQFSGFPRHHPSGRAFLGVPIRHQDRILGDLYLLDKVGGEEFSEEDEAILVAFAAQAALAMTNARLYDEVTAHARALEQKTQELARAHAALVETEKLRALGQMASGVAHDFNNVLASILGQVQLLETRLAQGAVPLGQIRAALRLLEQAVLDGAETVRKLREFTRPQGREPFEPVALSEVVEQVLETTRPRWKDQAEAQGFRFTILTDLNEVPPVLGNAAELREALTNLLFNALDAMPKGGTITISAKRVGYEERIGAAEGRTPHTVVPGEVVELTVTDSGVGMPQAVKARLFEPFFTTKGARGSGLGLSMVHGIVSRHKGEIHVTSAERRGTTVTLRLPVAQGVRLEPPAPAPPPQLPSRLRLLVIDNEPLLGETLADLLRTLGHEVVVASSGETGLARLRIETFDLLLTDLGMPGMSGWEVAQAARACCPDLPVILITGWREQLEAAQLAGSGVDAVVAKPYTLQGLLEGLGQAWAKVQDRRAAPA